MGHTSNRAISQMQVSLLIKDLQLCQTLYYLSLLFNYRHCCFQKLQKNTRRKAVCFSWKISTTSPGNSVPKGIGGRKQIKGFRVKLRNGIGPLSGIMFLQLTVDFAAQKPETVSSLTPALRLSSWAQIRAGRSNNGATYSKREDFM